MDDRWVCTRCFTSASADLAACPNCGAARSSAGSPSDSRAPDPSPAITPALPPPVSGWAAALPPPAVRYRSAATRARVAVGFLVAVLVLEIGFAAVELIGLTLTNLIYSTGPVSDEELLIGFLWAGATIVIAVAFIVALIGAGVAFIAWHSRTVDNIPGLGLGSPVQSPRWAIAWWFIPIGNLFMPYRSIVDAARRMQAPLVERNQLVLTWWLFFVSYDMASAVYGYYPTDTESQWLISGVLGVATSVLGVFAAWYAIRVVRAIQQDADAHEVRASTATPPDYHPDAVASA